MLPVQCELRCVTDRSSQTLFASHSIFIILPPSTVRNTKNKIYKGGQNKLQSCTGSCLSVIPTSMSKDIIHANTVCWKGCFSKITFLHSEICMALPWLSLSGITFHFLDSVIFFQFFFSQHSTRNTTLPQPMHFVL